MYKGLFHAGIKEIVEILAVWYVSLRYFVYYL